MMIQRLTAPLVLGMLIAACSNDPAAPTADEAEAPAAATNTAPASVDDDTLEPEAPKVEEGEEHNEDAPHSH